MIYIPVMEAFDDALRELGPIIGLIEQNAPEFEKRCASFINGLEALADNYKLPISAELAVIRGKITVGCTVKPAAERMRRMEARKEQCRYYLELLSQARQTVSDYFADSRRLFSECERACCQILVGIKTAQAAGDTPTAKKLVGLAESDKQLSQALAQIKGAVGVVNTEILFDKAMPTAGWTS